VFSINCVMYVVYAVQYVDDQDRGAFAVSIYNRNKCAVVVK